MADNTVSVGIVLEDKVSGPIKTTTKNIDNATKSIENSSKSASAGLERLATRVLTFEIAKKAVTGLSDSLKKVQEFEPVGKRLSNSFNQLSFELGKNMLPLVKQLTTAIEKISPILNAMMKGLAATFQEVQIVFSGLAVSILHPIDLVLGGLLSISVDLQKVIPGFDKVSNAIFGIRNNIHGLNMDMQASVSTGAKNLASILSGATEGTLAPNKPAGKTVEFASEAVGKRLQGGGADWAQSQFVKSMDMMRAKRAAEIEAQKAMEQEFTQWMVSQRVDADLEIINSAQLTAETITGIEQLASEDRTAIYQQEMDAKLNAAAGFAGGMASLLGQIAKENKKAGAVAKQFAIAEAIINGLSASVKIANSFAGTGPAAPALIALNVAGIAAFTAAQVMAISAQKFATGGIVGGTSYSGDRVPAMLNSGEMVLNQAQQAQLFGMANGRSGAAINVSDTIIVNGNADAGAIKEIKRSREDQLEQMRGMLKELKLTGQI